MSEVVSDESQSIIDFNFTSGLILIDILQVFLCDKIFKSPQHECNEVMEKKSLKLIKKLLIIVQVGLHTKPIRIMAF